MTRSMVYVGALAAMLGWTSVQATSGDPADPRGGRDWQGRACAHCQFDNPDSRAVSRIDRASRIATKLVAPNTCADPGPTAWFAEEEDHLTAFINSQVPQYK